MPENNNTAPQSLPPPVGHELDTSDISFGERLDALKPVVIDLGNVATASTIDASITLGPSIELPKLVVDFSDTDSSDTTAPNASQAAMNVRQLRERGELYRDDSTQPDESFIRLVEQRRQENIGGDLGSACIVNSLAVAVARANGAMPRPEGPVAKILTNKGARSQGGAGVYYDQISVSDYIADEDVGNLDVIQTRYSAMTSIADPKSLEDVLKNHGSAVFADRKMGHAVALIGIAQAGESLAGQTVAETSYLVYDGLPDMATFGVDTLREGPDEKTSSIYTVTAAQFAEHAANSHNVAILMQPRSMEAIQGDTVA